jgi:oligopeptidase B
VTSSNQPAPPIARKEPHPTTLHGHTLQDDYFWLREKESPEVIAYLNAENDYTTAVTAPLKPLEEKLYNEMLSHIKETDISVAYRSGSFFYYMRTTEGCQYPTHCRRAATSTAPDTPYDEAQPEQIILDVNKLAEGQPYMSLGAMAVSPDGKLLAYTTDNTGFRQYTLHIRDLTSGKHLVDIPSTSTDYELVEVAQRVGSLAWAADSRTIFYTVEDEATKRHNQLFRYTVGVQGQPSAEHTLIFDELDERYNIGVGRTRDGAYIILESASHITSECKVLPADQPFGDFRLLAPRVENEEYFIDHRNGHFYIRTNDKGRNFRLVLAPDATPGRENWIELLPHRDDVSLEDFDVFSSFISINETNLGLPKLRIFPLTGDAPRLESPQDIHFPEPTYSASAYVNREFVTNKFRYHYQSLVTPASVYEYDVATGISTLLKQQEVPGGFDRSLYASERIFATASDGVQIPISLVYRKDKKQPGTNPLYLYGYGSYGYALPVGFNPNRLSLLDRGLVLAYAHIRGGGDLGDPWHDAGKMMTKRTTFTDFITVAEHLAAAGYGDKARIAIEGGSAGGLLMGAVVNLRPDLFRAVLSHVPFVDVMNTMLDATLPLTVPEYEEWGNPNEKAAFEYMLSYSPYDNLKPGSYPAMLVKTSLNDSQVMYWEPAKYVAKLRTLKQNETPLLLHINMDAGHGGASGRYDYLKEIALDYAFLLTQLGVEKA